MEGRCGKHEGGGGRHKARGGGCARCEARDDETNATRIATAGTAGACCRYAWVSRGTRQAVPEAPTRSNRELLGGGDLVWRACDARAWVGGSMSERAGGPGGGSHGAGGRRAGGGSTYHEAVVGQEHVEEEVRWVHEPSTCFDPAAGPLRAPAPPAMSNAQWRSTVRCTRATGKACDGVRACLGTECNFSDAQRRRKSHR